ncbi:PCYCGC motif-containing (lipo)protein [Bacillus benzoevorans]|nr:PCYCGC motif-containing (lipo)protein [Bacillus benzoevorans]
MLSACTGQGAQSENEHDSSQQEYVLGDIREETQSADKLPNFLKEKPEEMQLIYAAAANHQELLESIPCYCGCADSIGHKDNYDCFVNENKENGAVVWDDHGTKCGICQDIAAQSIQEYENGKDIKEIRSIIDEQYKEGYPKPTPTPEVK